MFFLTKIFFLGWEDDFIPFDMESPAKNDNDFLFLRAQLSQLEVLPAGFF